ncbi:type II toxin-antitoxin system VapC family toxin [candidate division KSB1 bacterium]|nr:type II toxin-antitoxin system VapC family toxin [candidate division KSB1 bacterium]
MNKLLADTNIYIDYRNSGRFTSILEPSKPSDEIVYVSAVVIMELFSGTFTRSEIAFLDNLTKVSRVSNKLVVPPWSDYVEAGRLLAKLQSQKGYEIKKTIGLTNDVLIALSARRIGATVITQNKKDFEAIQSVKDFKLKIVS